MNMNKQKLRSDYKLKREKIITIQPPDHEKENMIENTMILIK